jgi:glycosyltransferase involved in cell wall biosynthesis
MLLLTSLGYEFAGEGRVYDVIELFDRFKIRPGPIKRAVGNIKEFRPDLVCILGAQHPLTYLLICNIIKLFSDMEIAFFPLDVFSNKDRPYETFLFRRLYKKMSHVFTNTTRQAEMVHDIFQVPRSRVSVSPIPDLTSFLHDRAGATPPDLPEPARLVLFFGLIQPRKGLNVLIDAFPEVVRQIPDAHLAIVGRADIDIEPFHAQIRRLGLEGSVTLRPDYVPFEVMADYFNAAEVVVLPYLVGWTSGAVASAFGFGKPVVATRVDALTEVITDGVNGLLVPPADAKVLAQAIARVLSDDQLRLRLSQGALAASAEISWDDVAHSTEDVLVKLLNERKN